jgi:tRNA threonylcarbamoyladenosine biosynthesis protein TsaB
MAWHGTAPLRAAVSNARRGEVYGAVYSARLQLVSPERVLGFSAWIDTLPDANVEFLSTDFSAFAAEIAQSRFRDAPRTTVSRALAGAVGRIAADRLAAGLAASPAAADANYVRRSDAELYWKES